MFAVLLKHVRPDEGAQVAGCLVVGELLVALIGGAAYSTAGGGEV